MKNRFKKLKIGVLTSSRAEYGAYKPLLRILSKEEKIDLTIIAFGMHLKEKFGKSINDIKKDSYGKIDIIEGLSSKDNPKDIVNSYGRIINEFSIYWEKNNYDLIITYGDRFEMSAAVQSGIPFELKYIHLHGGEVTKGAIDNVYRDQITLASKVHFVVTKKYFNRVAKLIGSKKNIYNFGSLSLDGLKQTNLPNWSNVCKKFEIENGRNYILVTFHPETVGSEKNHEYLKIIYSTLKEITETNNIIITLPNADTFANKYRSKMLELREDCPKKISLVENFGRENYFSAISNCNMLLGNSSSGIYEAATFNKYVINVGNRQKGRLQSKNIFNVTFNQKKILNQFKKVSAMGNFNGKNIFEKKDTARKMLNVIINE